MKLVECVPNFSEGRDTAKINTIIDEIKNTEGVKLLDVDPGCDTNRTVVTFVGPPESALEAAFKSIAKAAEVIDMSKHTGAHPRMGATDVCPFVPVSDVTMAECVLLSQKLAKKVGDELRIPIYLYEQAATRPERKNLADIRAGEYEGLPNKLQHPDWQPDYGPVEFNPKTGATVIGAREFLIAYNINLNTRDTRIANEIAGHIRETGRPKKDENGKIIRDENGEAVRIPGKFVDCKAVGWYMEDFGRAQISINFINYNITPPHIVFDECCRIAEELGVRVTGSELVGLMPLNAMLQAGRHYLKKQRKTTGVSDTELVHIAVLSLGLNDLYPFDVQKKIIEYNLSEKRPLVNMTVHHFADVLSSDAPAPGGGSVAALCGAMSSALSSMVAALTHGKKGYESAFSEMEEIGIQTQSLKAAFLRDVDDDTSAFNRVMEAFRLPKKTDEEKDLRQATLEAATKGATLVPLGVLRRCLDAIKFAGKVAEKGNKNSISDAGVAALCARTAAEGAFLNISINLAGLADQEFVEKTKTEARMLRQEIVGLADATLKTVDAVF